MREQPGLSITKAQLVQMGDLLRLSHEAQVSGWTAETLEAELQRKDAWFRVAAVGERLLGFALCHWLLDEAELLLIVVAPNSRRRGIGRSLLQAAKRDLVALGVRRLVLEVADNNHNALALYQQCGFYPEGRRPAYYANGQDALVLACALADVIGPDAL